MRFRNRRLRRLYERGETRGLNPAQVPRIDRILEDLESANVPSDVDLPGRHLHPLAGDRSGQWSVRVSGNWRIVFRFENGEAVDIDLVDYH